MTDKLELKSCHEVVYTVDVADVDSIFYCKPTDPDILTVLMKDGKRLYCDEVCPIDSLQEEPVSGDIQKVGSLKSLEYYPEKKTTNKTSKGVFDANMPRRKAYLRGFKDGAHAHKVLIANKPVSEDLEEASRNYADNEEYGDDVYFAIKAAFKVGAKWQKDSLWKLADGDDLPVFDREVVVLIKYGAQHNIHDKEYSTYRVGFGHRPNPNGWDGKNIDTNKVTHYTPKLYGKGGWNAPDIVYWLDCSLPNMEED